MNRRTRTQEMKTVERAFPLMVRMSREILTLLMICRLAATTPARLMTTVLFAGVISLGCPLIEQTSLYQSPQSLSLGGSWGC